MLDKLKDKLNTLSQVDQLILIDELMKYLNGKKDEIRNSLPAGNYRARKGTVKVQYVDRKGVDIKKYFAYMLRKGKMKGFINSVSVSVASMEHEGIAKDEIEKFRFVEKTYKLISIKKS
jgi:hypothetical protein